MADNNGAPKPPEEPALTQEMGVAAEPLSAAEKKLIGYSLGIGVALLVLMVILTGVYRF